MPLDYTSPSADLSIRLATLQYCELTVPQGSYCTTIFVPLLALVVQKYLLYLYKANGLTAYRPREACPLAFPTSSLKENRCRSFLCIFRHGKLPAPCTAASPQDCCTSAYVSIRIRQYTSETRCPRKIAAQAYVSIRQHSFRRMYRDVPARLQHDNIRQHMHTSSIRIRQHSSVPRCARKIAAQAYVSIRIRQHTSAYLCQYRSVPARLLHKAPKSTRLPLLSTVFK